jgi:NAD(P)H dehydrogenase (quinone)
VKGELQMTIPNIEGLKPRALIVGSTGRIGAKLINGLEQNGTIQVVRASRNQHQVDGWIQDGNQAVLLDLDRPDSFAAALAGVKRLFLSTGYTVAMLQQSKTLIDAAAEAGVEFVVHRGVFGNGRLTYSYGAWHELEERYIEGSGMAWTHLHPHFFMNYLLQAAPIIEGKP